ncbi:MAG TPA: SURF1 family protein [Gemmatimonadales bacterium]
MSSRARLLLIAFFGLAALVCARLGIWQVQRLHERRAANAVALAARAQDPVRLDSVMAGDSSLIERHVLVRGRYDHARDIVLRGRAYQGSPGVEIVTPLVLEGGRAAVLVSRGFVPAPDAASVLTDSLREPGLVTVKGLALALPSGQGVPLERPGGITWARLDLEALGDRMPYTLAPIYIRQEPDARLPRFPRRLEPPPIDDGPHLNYAIQWFSFAVMAVGFGIVVWRQQRERGKDERERD